jgi:hypothetical protein
MLTLVNIIFAVFVTLGVISVIFCIKYIGEQWSKRALFWAGWWWISLTGINASNAARCYLTKNMPGVYACSFVTVLMFIYAVIYWSRYWSTDYRK